MTNNAIFNTHMHTFFSHDGKCSVDEMCHAAMENHLTGIAITDHCDSGTEFWDRKVLQNIRNSVLQATAAKEKYANQCKVLVGVEMGEAIVAPQNARQVYDIGGYDIILGSVHCVRQMCGGAAFSTIDFSSFSDEALSAYMAAYFDDMKEMLQTTDLDVTAHLTIPLRYINGKYHRRFSLAPFGDEIDTLLRLTIARGAALELNTSGFPDQFFPDAAILSRYRELGGQMVTLGSDAHITQNITVGLSAGRKLLHACGFATEYYFEQRKPHKVFE